MKTKTLNLYQLFNHPDTLVVISSFPEQDSEVSKENAVARYTDLLLKNFPKNQKLVVLSEQRTALDKPYLVSPNILVVPTFVRNSIRLFGQLNSQLSNFPHAKSILIQFEFSIFGNPLLTFGFAPFCFFLKSQGKKVTISLHQVISNINDVADHIGISPKSMKSQILNTGLHNFYRFLGQSVQNIVVHDHNLAEKLAQFVSREKIAVIPHGIGPTRPFTLAEKAKARNCYGFKTTDFVVTAYGYQSLYKGTDWIVEAVGKFAQKNPALHIKLLLAGDLSPTQKNKPQYQLFVKKLKELIKKYAQITTVIGFVPEQKVDQVYAASDVVVFPYRARMSASGALSLAWQYQIPFLVSESAAENLTEQDVALAFAKAGAFKNQATFSLNQKSFAEKLIQLINNSKLRQQMATVGEQIAQERNWKQAALKYLVTSNKQNHPVKISQKLTSLSVFFPMHNEAENVQRVIQQAQQILPTIAHKFEIIVVNDGSTDNTAKLANQLAKKDKHIKVISQQNMGYGGALQTGFQAAQYEWIFFSDGDLQFDLSDLANFLPQTKKYQVVLGYRQHRSDALSRIALAEMLKIWNKIFFQFPSKIKDVDCAFKLFHRSVLQHLFPLQSSGAMISTELLLRLVDEGYDFAQIPVNHYPRLYGHQTGAQMHVVFGALKETLKLWSSRFAEKRPIPNKFARYFAITSTELVFVLYRMFHSSGQ